MRDEDTFVFAGSLGAVGVVVEKERDIPPGPDEHPGERREKPAREKTEVKKPERARGPD